MKILAPPLLCTIVELFLTLIYYILILLATIALNFAHKSILGLSSIGNIQESGIDVVQLLIEPSNIALHGATH